MVSVGFFEVHLYWTYGPGKVLAFNAVLFNSEWLGLIEFVRIHPYEVGEFTFFRNPESVVSFLTFIDVRRLVQIWLPIDIHDLLLRSHAGEWDVMSIVGIVTEYDNNFIH